MERSKQRKYKFSVHYHRIMLATLLVVLLISLILLSIQVSQRNQHIRGQLLKNFENRSLAIDNLVGSVVDHVEIIQEKAESFLWEDVHHKYREESPFYKALSNVEWQENFFSLDNIPASDQNRTGNVTGEGIIKKASTDLKEDLEMSLSLNSLFRASKINIPNSSWIYYTSKNKFINIYPWKHSKGAFTRFTPDLYNHEFFKWGTPAVNKFKERFWTPAYIDEYGEGLMVTAAKPVYKGDEFLGTTAIDITLDQLIDYVKSFESEGTLMIVNQQGQLIAHPELSSSDKSVASLKDKYAANEISELQVLFKDLDKIEEKFMVNMRERIDTISRLAMGKNINSLVERIKQLKQTENLGILQSKISKSSLEFGSPTLQKAFKELALHIEKLEMMVQSPNYLLYRMKHAPWNIVFIPERKNMFLEYLSMKNGTIVTFFVLVISLTIMVVTANRMTYNQFIHPAESLVNHIECESKDIKTKPPVVPKAWRPWFGTISKTFEENRNLIGLLREDKKKFMPNFVILLNLEEGSGGTIIGNAIANSFVNSGEAGKTTIYTEFPDPKKICGEMGLDLEQNVYKHPNGYDIWSSFSLGSLPEEVRASFLVNKMLRMANNIVMNFSASGDSIDESLKHFLEYANLVVLLYPLKDTTNKAEKLMRQVREQVNQDQTFTFELLNRAGEAFQHKEYSVPFDYEIPFCKDQLQLSKDKYTYPEEITHVTDELANRTEKVESISIFIPSTINVNIKIDTKEYISKACNVFGGLFGGATSKSCEGVWNSEESGLVSEEVQVVMSYTTDKILKKKLDEVFEFARQLKSELSQEAIAVEVNRKLILV